MAFNLNTENKFALLDYSHQVNHLSPKSSSCRTFFGWHKDIHSSQLSQNDVQGEATTWRIWASAPPASDIPTYLYNSSARFLWVFWAALFSEIIFFFFSNNSYRATSLLSLVSLPCPVHICTTPSPSYTFSCTTNWMASLVPGVNLSLEMYGEKKSTYGAPRRVWCQLQKISVGCPRSTLWHYLTSNQPGASSGAWARASVSCLCSSGSSPESPWLRELQSCTWWYQGAEHTESQFPLKLRIV